MDRRVLNLIILGIILVLAQAVVLNHICLWGVAVPIVFFYLILRLPVTLSIYWVLTIGFFTGLLMDMLSDTYGLNALCCTMLAGLRRPLLRLYQARPEEITPPQPSMRSLGIGSFLKYMVTATLIYCTMVFLIDSMTYFHPVLMVIRIGASTLLSALLIAGIDALTSLSR